MESVELKSDRFVKKTNSILTQVIVCIGRFYGANLYCVGKILKQAAKASWVRETLYENHYIRKRIWRVFQLWVRDSKKLYERIWCTEWECEKVHIANHI